MIAIEVCKKEAVQCGRPAGFAVHLWTARDLTKGVDEQFARVKGNEWLGTHDVSRHAIAAAG